MNKFEYKVIAKSESEKHNFTIGTKYFEIEEFLNKMGDDGWELVSISEDDGSYMAVLVFKRAVMGIQEKQLLL